MDDLLMGLRDARRLGAVEAALCGEKSNREAAQQAKLSLRQFKRLRRRYRLEGPAGLVHGNRGRPSPRRLTARTRERIVELLHHPRAQLNDCHIRDLLLEQGERVSAETVRQIRRSLGQAPKRRRRPNRHHRRRERAAQSGALALIDGSPFPWFGPDQPSYCLVGTLDDATGHPLSGCFRPQEDLHGFAIALRDLILTHGVPEKLYGDRTNIAIRNDRYWSREEEFAGRQLPTHFGRMLEELGIQYIGAHSPEAKGRIERLWQTFQDRLAAEFALHQIRDPEAAAHFLPYFFARCRGWFGHPPRESRKAWRPVPPHLDWILACCYPRTVARDNTVTITGRVIQIPPGPHRRSYHRYRVEVRELLDGRALVFYQGRLIAEQPAPSGPFTLVPHKSARDSSRARAEREASGSRRIADRPPPRLQSPSRSPHIGQLTNIRRPSKNHPWKREYKPNLLPSSAGA